MILAKLQGSVTAHRSGIEKSELFCYHWLLVTDTLSSAQFSQQKENKLSEKSIHTTQASFIEYNLVLIFATLAVISNIHVTYKNKVLSGSVFVAHQILFLLCRGITGFYFPEREKSEKALKEKMHTMSNIPMNKAII